MWEVIYPNMDSFARVTAESVKHYTKKVVGDWSLAESGLLVHWDECQFTFFNIVAHD